MDIAPDTQGLSPTQRIALDEIASAPRGMSDAALTRRGIRAATVQALRRRRLVEWDERELASGATIHVLTSTIERTGR